MPSDGTLFELAADLIGIDSVSSHSNLGVAEVVEAQLDGFTIERLDWTEPGGVAKRALVARRGRGGGVAFSAHMDTVPPTGWSRDPFSAELDAHGVLHGLGSADMKGPLAAIIHAARALPADIPVSLLITTDEETTKEGARRIVRDSRLLREGPPRAIIIAEPTGLRPVRGHRGCIDVTAESIGVQAHSATGRGRNANWALLPFLAEMRALQVMLREDPAWRDSAYDPPFCDLNLVIDNYGAASNVTVPRATARIKLRTNRSLDMAPIIARIREAADACEIQADIREEPPPPELAVDHPLVTLCAELSGNPAETAPYGTDASELQAIAPCVVMGPGDIAVAHTPGERVALRELEAAVALFQTVALRVAAAG